MCARKFHMIIFEHHDQFQLILINQLFSSLFIKNSIHNGWVRFIETSISGALCCKRRVGCERNFMSDNFYLLIISADVVISINFFKLTFSHIANGVQKKRAFNGNFHRDVSSQHVDQRALARRVLKQKQSGLERGGKKHQKYALRRVERLWVKRLGDGRL